MVYRVDYEGHDAVYRRRKARVRLAGMTPLHTKNILMSCAGRCRNLAMGLVRASGRAIDNGQPSLRGRAELRSTTFSPYEAA